jgi:sugar phosphate isomerase/epimerase
MTSITRRDLLAAAIGGAVAKGASAKPKGVRFGVRTPLPNVSLRERALLAAKIGFDGIELGREWLDQSTEALQKQIEGVGVAVSAIVGSIGLLSTEAQKRREAVELDRRRLEMAKQLGADCVIEVPVFGPNKFSDVSPSMTAKDLEQKLLIEGLKQLTADVKRTGVTLLLEPCNHKETHFLNTQGYGAELIHQVDAPGFKLLSDFYHMQIEEKDIGETLASVGNLTGYVHLADGEKRTYPGSLPFDYRPGFHSLKKWGYSGWITMEFKATNDPADELGRALGYIKEQWAAA